MKAWILGIAMLFSTCLVLANPEKIKAEKKDELIPTRQSILEKKLEETNEASAHPFAFALYHRNYILPFYYTASPDYAVYQNTTPDNRRIMTKEFKGQLSIQMPIINHLFYDRKASLNIAYTQLSYWQFYATSQFFRETDYEPEIFIQRPLYGNWLLQYGLNHQSSGFGGSQERSWNRLIIGTQFSGEKWIASIKAWGLVFKKQSSSLHNPDIAHYLGHENVGFIYQLNKGAFSLQLQNIESLLRRGFVQLSFSYPIANHFSIYTQFFSGYGQSLIEYNHRTNAAGIGITFNDVV